MSLSLGKKVIPVPVQFEEEVTIVVSGQERESLQRLMYDSMDDKGFGPEIRTLAHNIWNHMVGRTP